MKHPVTILGPRLAALMLLTVLACAKEKQKGPDLSGLSTAQKAAVQCLQHQADYWKKAARTLADHQQPAPPDLRAYSCPAVYSKVTCADSWRGLGLSTDSALIIAAACSAAYCDVLEGERKPVLCTNKASELGPATLVRALVQLDTSILVHEGLAPEQAAQLAARMRIFRIRAQSAAGAAAASAGTASAARLIIAIDSTGTITVGSKPIDRADLPRELQRRMSTGSLSVGIRADAATKYEQVVRLMNEIRAAGVDQIAIEAK